MAICSAGGKGPRQSKRVRAQAGSILGRDAGNAGRPQYCGILQGAHKPLRCPRQRLSQVPLQAFPDKTVRSFAELGPGPCSTRGPRGHVPLISEGRARPRTRSLSSPTPSLVMCFDLTVSHTKPRRRRRILSSSGVAGGVALARPGVKRKVLVDGSMSALHASVSPSSKLVTSRRSSAFGMLSSTCSSHWARRSLLGSFLSFSTRREFSQFLPAWQHAPSQAPLDHTQLGPRLRLHLVLLLNSELATPRSQTDRNALRGTRSWSGSLEPESFGASSVAMPQENHRQVQFRVTLSLASFARIQLSCPWRLARPKEPAALQTCSR